MSDNTMQKIQSIAEMTIEPQDRVALITGAGGGIGRAIAETFAHRGIRGLMLFDVDGAALDLSAAALADVDVDVLTRVVDVADAEQMADGFAATVEHFGALDYVCNNAATQTWQPAFPRAEMADVHRVLDVNIRGVVLGCQLAFDVMSTNGGGSIVNTASGAGKVGLPSDPLYAATKAAVIMLTKSSAPSFGEADVRINAVCPGLVDTVMLARSLEGMPKAQSAIAHAPKLEPHDVAAAIVDLATNPELTGQTPSVFA